jgi:hypothetical protein
MRTNRVSAPAGFFLLSALLWAGGPEQAHAELPRDWLGRGNGTEQILDHTVRHAGTASGSIRSTGAAGGFGSHFQAFRADRYRGKRLRMTAFVKSENVDGFAVLWMRIDGKDKISLAADSIQDRPIRSTTDSRQNEIVLDVPGEAVEIIIAVLLRGKGRVWVDDIHLDIVGREVATTGREPHPADRTQMPRSDLPQGPSNLDFEAGPGRPTQGLEAIVRPRVEASDRHMSEASARGQPGSPGHPKHETRLNPGTSLGIVRRPPPSPPISEVEGKLRTLPTPDPNALIPHFEVDLRGQDVSQFDLKDKSNVLRLADFDSQTRWPEPPRMPAGFDPGQILELGKDPGLGIRGLHARGITGKGVGVAIIDQTLLIDHDEYKDRLRTYEEINKPTTVAAMHAPGVASIAVGKTVGVAPEADLYLIAERHITGSGARQEIEDLFPVVESIDRILAIDAGLPAGRKIRVISMSFGYQDQHHGYEAMVQAVARAKARGIFVVLSALYDTYPDHPSFLVGAGRDPISDPNERTSYEMARVFVRQMTKPVPTTVDWLSEKARRGIILVPIDSRAIASPTGPHDYVFYRSGGLSWGMPYLAGLYALACQVKPDVTGEQFLGAASRTGDRLELPAIERLGIRAMMVNPAGLIASLTEEP